MTLNFGNLQLRMSPVAEEDNDVVNLKTALLLLLNQLPPGPAGTLYVSDGTGIVQVPPPEGMTRHPILRFNLDAPGVYWQEPTTCPS